MISCFVKEQHRYSLSALCSIFEMTAEKTKTVIKRLRVCGLVKTVNCIDTQFEMTELADDDIVMADTLADYDVYYVFTYVGVITIAGRIIKCYPKYLPFGASPLNEMKQIVRVLEKYNRKKQIIKPFAESGDQSAFSLLSVMLLLLSDYHENGLYSNSQDQIENNGDGEILWDRTINDTFAVLSKNQPYYTQFKTIKHAQDDYYYFRRLHAWVLTEISTELNQTDLSELFDIATVNLSDETLDDFGDVDTVLTQIEKELRVVFSTRKQLVLNAMYAYFSGAGHLNSDDCIALWGTTSFNLVWEEACSETLQNQLYTPIGSLPLPAPLSPKYLRDTKLIDLIDKPVWSSDTFAHIAPDTLIPDIVSLQVCSKQHVFCIFDAKYYVAQIAENQPLRGQPGIESITKQYLYQLAYKQFLEDHNITKVINCFLLPTVCEKVIVCGNASLQMMDNLGLQKINVRKIPASLVFSSYLDGKHIPLELLNVLADEPCAT